MTTIMTSDTKKDTFAKRVLTRIDEEQVVPRARWAFVFKNYTFWGFSFMSMVFGALALSAILFEVTSIDWQLAPVTHSGFGALLLDAIPYLWVIVLLFFVGIGCVNVRHTKHGYRYPLWLIALGAVLTSVALGAVLHIAGLGELVDRAPRGRVPFYRPIVAEQQTWWLAPEKGFLSGRILSVASDAASFTVRDFNGVLWSVTANDLSSRDFAVVARGGTVRVVGIPAAATSTTFRACFVIPWMMHDRGQMFVPPFVMVASTSERSFVQTRSEECRGIRPYQQIRSVDESGVSN